MQGLRIGKSLQIQCLKELATAAYELRRRSTPAWCNTVHDLKELLDDGTLPLCRRIMEAAMLLTGTRPPNCREALRAFFTPEAFDRISKIQIPYWFFNLVGDCAIQYNCVPCDTPVPLSMAVVDQMLSARRREACSFIRSSRAVFEALARKKQLSALTPAQLLYVAEAGVVHLKLPEENRDPKIHLSGIFESEQQLVDELLASTPIT